MDVKRRVILQDPDPEAIEKQVSSLSEDDLKIYRRNSPKAIKYLMELHNSEYNQEKKLINHFWLKLMVYY